LAQRSAEQRETDRHRDQLIRVPDFHPRRR